MNASMLGHAKLCHQEIKYRDRYEIIDIEQAINEPTAILSFGGPVWKCIGGGFFIVTS